MPRKVLDSYTGDEYQEEYVSPHKGINEPRTLFKKGRPWTCTTQYEVRREGDSWQLLRENTPPSFFPSLPSEEAARKALDWCVRSDASIEIVIGRLKSHQDIDAYFRMLDYIQEAISG